MTLSEGQSGPYRSVFSFGDVALVWLATVVGTIVPWVALEMLAQWVRS